ncbi:hypothetical protein IJG14_04175 [bacterium]|nr:hypothetical protein [bacterium]
MTISTLITKIVEKYNPSFLYHDDGIVSSQYSNNTLPINGIILYCLFFGFPIISILLKILVFPVLYKIKFFSNIKDFLERFATDKNFLIKVLFSVLIFDIIVYLLSVFLFTKKLNIYELKEAFIMYLFVFFGVLPCYLTFLLWYKWTHRKKSEQIN